MVHVCLFAKQSLQLLLVLDRRHIRQVGNGQRDGDTIVDNLAGRTFALRKTGTETFVAAREFANAGFEQRNLDLPAKPHEGRDVVDRALRRQPAKEPHSLLSKGKRQRLCAVHFGNRRPRVLGGVLGIAKERYNLELVLGQFLLQFLGERTLGGIASETFVRQGESDAGCAEPAEKIPEIQNSISSRSTDSMGAPEAPLAAQRTMST